MAQSIAFWGEAVRRRDFMKAVGGVAAALPVSAIAQAKPVIGFLSAVSPGPFAQRIAAFHRGLAEAGYEEGRNLIIESRWAEEKYDRLPALAAELIGRPVEVLVTYTDAAALAAKKATTSIPIVFINGADPVRAGIVSSLGRPGGNITGASFFGVDVAPKELSLLHEIVPGVTVVGFFVDQNLPDAVAQVPGMQDTARRLGLQLSVQQVRTAADIDAAFDTFARERVGAFVVGSNGLPAIYPFREFAVDGGLISYGSSVLDTFRQGGTYAGRILKGDKPANLPVVLSTKYEMVLNLRTAKALGLSLSPVMLNTADDLIE